VRPGSAHFAARNENRQRDAGRFDEDAGQQVSRSGQTKEKGDRPWEAQRAAGVSRLESTATRPDKQAALKNAPKKSHKFRSSSLFRDPRQKKIADLWRKYLIRAKKKNQKNRVLDETTHPTIIYQVAPGRPPRCTPLTP